MHRRRRRSPAQYGFVDAANGITVTAQNNQTCPNGTTTCYLVTISDTQAPQFFSPVLGIPAPNLSASAMAGQTQTYACVLALDPAASGAVTLNGNAYVNLNCGLAIDSSSSSALLMSGTNSLTATSANIVGGISLNTASSNTLAIPLIKTGGSYVADPYANLQVPSFAGCSNNGVHIAGSGSVTIEPGVYCGNISISGSPTVTLDPGTYIIDQGSFTVSGSPTITGNGVAIVLTSSTGSGIGNLSVTGTPSFNLTAEASGYSGAYALPGFVLYQDRRASGGSSNFSGTAGSVLTGGIYFPSSALTFNGTPTTGPGCTQVVVLTLTFNGHPHFYNDTCTSQFGLAQISAGALVQLVQ